MSESNQVQLCFNSFDGERDAGEYTCFLNVGIGVSRTCTVNVTAGGEYVRVCVRTCIFDVCVYVLVSRMCVHTCTCDVHL